MQKKETVFNLVKQVLAEDTFNDINDFQPQSILAVELNLTPDDVVTASKKICSQLAVSCVEIEKSIRANEIETVDDLVDAFIEEMELG